MATATARRLLLTSRSMTPEEQNDLRQALRDAIMFMVALKMCAGFCYIGIYFLVDVYSDGFWSTILQIMILILIPLEIFNGLLLFLGALENQPVALKFAALMCLLVAVLNTVMGVMGVLFFFRIGDRPIHFIISFLFGLIALGFCSVLCHDVVVIAIYEKLITNPPPLLPNSQNPPTTLAITNT